MEDCYTEDVVSRSVNSDVFLHFEILEPAVTDAVDVQLTSPSGRGIQAWSGSKGNHTSILVRESGLYSVCFTKTASSTIIPDYPSIVYSIQVADEGGSARLTGNAHSIMAHYPVITFEDMGLDVMREIGHFRYSVWDLKGELISIIQNERHSRNSTLLPTTPRETLMDAL
ncbi:hypothetical protein DYB32_006909 [Aphanomyces invadans]|uniref:GOLD domain-containing protein n=1 Tax=Aphanomyces invadans TaxID=157072 RepID=A0A3R6Z160_9STRA|nr:hypothetical protein DYB32_006909 [Aphanomyces invadans]